LLRLLTGLLCLAVLALAGCGDDDEDSGSGGGGSESPATESPATETTATETTAEGGCQDVEQPAPKPDGRPRAYHLKLDPAKTFDVVLTTSCGDITIRLDQKTSPKTAASFAFLARTGFFDGTVFHRIVPGFVIQGGDPTGSGSGGPGYSTRDVPPPDTSYVQGTVAMAKAATEPPGTAGSQFYIVTAPDAGLQPDYALLGEVVKGQDVVDEIGQLGDPASGDAGVPLQAVVIESAELVER
jgi:peptidyl-prolyl cis-trans isomerase B (cyclophilin B)